MQPEELTGEYVRQVREARRPRMSRDRFAEEARLPARAAMWRIETKDQWKPGERELVATFLATLESISTPGDGATNVQPAPPDPQLGQCGPCVHGHHSACRRPTSATSCCCGNAITDTRAIIDGKREEILAAHRAGLHTTQRAANCDLCADERRATDTTVTFLLDPDADDVTITTLRDGDERPVTRVVPTWDPRDPNGGPYVMSNGQRATWQRCERKWWFAWYLGRAVRYPDLTGVRSTGDRIHRALASWYVPDGQPRVDPRDALERAIVEDWTTIHAQATEQGHDENQLAGLARRFEQAAQLERVMVAGYVEWLAETGADQDLKVVASETVLQADLELRERDDMLGGWWTRPVRVVGLVDARLVRTTDDAYLFEDHKTVGSLTEVLPFLPQNEQMLHYELLQWLTSRDAERRCDGALYNMLKRSKRTDRATPPFYSRVEVRHNEGELESYKRRLLKITRDIVRTVDRLNAGEHHLDVVAPRPTKDCRWECDFAAICPLFDDPTARAEDALTSLFVEVDVHDRYSIR